jgi:hypothetical protein
MQRATTRLGQDKTESCDSRLRLRLRFEDGCIEIVEETDEFG